MKFKIENKKIVRDTEFDELVKEVYGIPYVFQQQYGCQNRGLVSIKFPLDLNDYENDSIEFEVNGEDEGVSFHSWVNHNKGDLASKFTNSLEVDLFYSRNFYPDISMVVDDLVKKGYIDEEDFYIDIDW